MPVKLFLYFSFALFNLLGLTLSCIAQNLTVKGFVTSYKSNQYVHSTVVLEKQPDASVTVISESGPSGYHAKIIYKAQYLIKVSSPGFINSYLNLNLDDDSLKDKSVIFRNFALVPIQLYEILPFREILFEVTSFKITQQSIPELDHLVEILTNNPGIKIQLEGHTDTQGKGRKSMKLARRRIQTIKEYLVSKGVESKRIRLKAMAGENRSFFSDSDEGRKGNRRVEIRVIGV